jgi:hypothetical protein
MKTMRTLLQSTRMALVLAAIGAIPLAARADTSSSLLRPYLTTDRGCLETGGPATFALGDDIIIFLGASSSTVSQAKATLFLSKPNGTVAIFGLGSIITNATYGFVGRVGAPLGVHRLGLKVSAGGVTSRRSCSFNVVDPSVTRTPTATRTTTRIPTPTRTPTIGSPPPSVTPGGALRPRIKTNRGCEETGDAPVFRVGEIITLSFGVDSGNVAFARGTIYDVLANGQLNLIPVGTLVTNRTYSLRAGVAPPIGRETVRLRASVGTVSAISDDCSFAVIATSSRTRTPTRTATATRTRPTASPTATPTP